MNSIYREEEEVLVKKMLLFAPHSSFRIYFEMHEIFRQGTLRPKGC